MPAQEVNVGLGHLHIAGDQVEGRLDSVAQADVGHVRHPAQPVADGGHGVGVVEQHGAGLREPFHVLHEVGHDGHAAQTPHDTARPERVADALVHAVLERDLVVVAERLDAADLDHADHVVGVADGVLAARGGADARVDAVLGNHASGEGLHPPQLGFRRAHEGIRRALQRRCGEHIVEQRPGEYNAPCADHGDLHRGIPP